MRNIFTALTMLALVGCGSASQTTSNVSESARGGVKSLVGYLCQPTQVGFEKLDFQTSKVVYALSDFGNQKRPYKLSGNVLSITMMDKSIDRYTVAKDGKYLNLIADASNEFKTDYKCSK